MSSGTDTTDTPSIGGTSGTSGSSGNMLSVNLGGVNANFDLGPSVSTVSAQAYSFLNNSFNSDSALLGQTIMGSNALVGGLANSVLGMAAQQQQVNDQVLPGMFTSLANQDYSLGTQAIGAETSVANASIAQSNATARSANSGGGGLCYITTAVCDTLGLPDDCHTLQTLRHFRDTYMARTNVRRALVQEYYATAPAVVRKLSARADAAALYEIFFRCYLLPAIQAIECGDDDRAFRCYRRLVYRARAEAHRG